MYLTIVESMVYLFFLIILFDRRPYAYDGHYTISTYGEHGPFPSLPGTPGSLCPCADAHTDDGSFPRRPTSLGSVWHPTLLVRLGTGSLLFIGFMWVGLAS